MRKIENQEISKKNDLNDFFIQSTHPEHNISVSKMKMNLLDLNNPTLQDVRNYLRGNYTVVLISKEEQKVLNGSKKKLYQLDGQMVPGAGLSVNGEADERLAAIGAVIDPAHRQNLIEYIFQRFGPLFN
jgi:hypothetical protein